MTAAVDLHAVLDQLLDVERQLLDLPADAFEQRVELRERILELRAAASAAAQRTDAPSTLRRYLKQLELRRERIKRHRLDYTWQDGGLGGIGIPAKQTDELNRRIEEAHNLPELEREITRIRAKLAAGTAT
jgi:hypothetical protein